MKRPIALLLVLALAAWLGFFQIADLMLSGRADAWNVAIMQQMPLWHAAWLTPVVVGLTQCGSEIGVTLIGLGTIIVLDRQGHRRDAVLVAMLLIGAGALTYGLKGIYLNPRPQVFLPLVAETGHSFPSGHALTGWSFFGYLTIRSCRYRQWAVGVMAACLAVAMPLSRLYLGVHWPTDVLAGLCVGTFWLSTCLAIQATWPGDTSKSLAT
jgi:undecaprenyl-diphosphatase